MNVITCLHTCILHVTPTQIELDLKTRHESFHGCNLVLMGDEGTPIVCLSSSRVSLMWLLNLGSLLLRVNRLLINSLIPANGMKYDITASRLGS